MTTGERAASANRLPGASPDRLQDLGVWLSSPLRQLGAALAVAAIVAFLSASQLYVNWTLQGFEADYGALFASEATEWLLWALAVPVILRLDTRLGFGSGRPGRALLLHSGVALAWFGFQNVVLTYWSIRVDGAAAGPFGDVYLNRAVLKVPSALAVYATVLAAGWAIRSAIRQGQLRRALIEAQLRNLRAQIRPHFLFNALHVVGSLVRAGRREEAVATLVALSDLLRRALTLSDVEKVPLREELSFARSYLEIQKTRFGDRLRVSLGVSPEAEPVLVPALLLQPLVENAVRHGVDPEQRGGCVSITARLEGGRLVLAVSDSGRGEGSGRAGFGIGLRNVRDRLARLYGAGHALELRDRPEGGSEVRVVLPARSRPGRGS